MQKSNVYGIVHSFHCLLNKTDMPAIPQLLLPASAIIFTFTTGLFSFVVVVVGGYAFYVLRKTAFIWHHEDETRIFHFIDKIVGQNDT